MNVNRPPWMPCARAGQVSLVLILLASACSGFAAESLAATEAAYGNLPAHPRLLLNAQGVTNLEHRIRTQPWARRTWDGIKSGVEQSLKKPVVLPPRGGNWSHNYVCPEHGARLERGRRLGEWEWEHKCPVGPHTLRGDPAVAGRDFDGNAIASEHGRLAHESINAGLLFQITREDRYAKLSREILLAYAGRYLSYPLHNNQGRPGSGARVASQSLTEAGWLTQMAQGADLVWTTLTPEQQTNLIQNLFRPALDQVVIPRPSGIHNIQCHRNSAIGSVGLLIGDLQLIHLAVNDSKLGFHQQLAKGVSADGLWFEGSSGYHFYTISGLWPLAQASFNCGVDLFGPAFRQMFDGPLKLAMPNLVLPNFNDSGYVDLSNQADLYELALAHWPSPEYARMVASGKRQGLIPLLYGVERLPTAKTTPPTASRNLPDSGYAILQQGAGSDATWLCLKYGPHGGGHGHPDKNSFVLYAHGRVVAPDSGTHAYGSPLHKGWDKTTLAHNTLVADQSSQAQATGRLIGFGSSNGVEYCMADAGPIYQGLSFIRSVVLLNADLVLFIDQVSSDKERLLDLAYHQEGNWLATGNGSPSASPWSPPDLPGYQYLTETSIQGCEPLAELKLAASERKPASLIVTPVQPLQLVKGYGILKTTKDLTPILIQRTSGREAVFVWAVSLDETKVSLSTQLLQGASGQDLRASEALLVTAKAGPKQWAVVANPKGLPFVIRQSATAGGTPLVIGPSTKN